MNWTIAAPALLGPLVALVAGSAFAAGSFDDGSDILGLSLKTPADQVRSTFTASSPGSVVSDVHAVITSQQTQEDVVVGYAIDATSTEDQSAGAPKDKQDAAETQALGGTALDKVVLQPGDRGENLLRVSISPNPGDNRVYGIARRVEFPKDSMPPIDTVVGALVEKYGPPLFTSKRFGGGRDLFWASGAAPRKSQRALASCGDNAHLLLNISAGDNYRQYDPGLDVSGTALVSTVNLVTSSTLLDVWKKCGTILHVVVVPPANVDQEQYAVVMNEWLIDYSDAYVGMKKFADDFWTKANGASQKTLQDAAKNKPKL